MKSNQVKQLMLTLGMISAIIMAISYLNSPADDITPVAQAQTNPTLTKEVSNVTDNTGYSANGTANPGERLKYRLTYSNPGTTDITDAKLLDVLPNDTTFITVNDNGVYSQVDNAVSWSISKITAGATGSVSYEVKVNAVADQTVIENSAFIYTANLPKGVQSSESKVTVSSPTLTVNLSVDKPTVKRGDNLIYTIALQNTGNVDAQSVKLIDTLPADISFLQSNTTPASINGSVIEFHLNTIAKGATQTVTITATVSANAPVDGTLVNNIMVNYSDQTGTSYPSINQSASSTTSKAAATTTTPTKAPKTGGEFVPSVILSLALGLVVTLFFFYKHEPLSFAGAKVSVWQSREKIDKLQSDYLSRTSIKLATARWKARIKNLF